MSAIDSLFDRLRNANRKALMPFVTAGDPDLQFTAEVIRELVARGSSICEVGIPYSDPIADGPVIQASYTRSLAKKTKLAEILETLGRLTSDVSAPIVTMVSYAIVYRHGLEQYIADAKAAGVAGAIVPDLPVEESGPLAEICRREDFGLIQLVTPTTPRDRAVRIAEQTTGFIYYVSVTGITGARTDLPQELIQELDNVRAAVKCPVAVGFGISTPEQVANLAPHVDGVVVGSAIVQQVAQFSGPETIKQIGDFVAGLKAPLRRSSP